MVFTQDKYLQLKVHAEVVDPKTGVHETTNVFHYTFCTMAAVPPVIPKSYAGIATLRDHVTYISHTFKAMCQHVFLVII